jgi:hypothetical protein
MTRWCYQYEGLCRYFRSRRKPRDPPDLPTTPYATNFHDAHGHGSGPLSTGATFGYTTDVATAHHHRVQHDSLIREAEAEMNQLSWGELMLAGGLAGMVSWSVSRAFPHPSPRTPPHPTSSPLNTKPLPPSKGNLPPRRPQNPNPIRPAGPTNRSYPRPNDPHVGLPRCRSNERDEGVL